MVTLKDIFEKLNCYNWNTTQNWQKSSAKKQTKNNWNICWNLL